VGCTRASVCGLTYAFSCKFATQSELGQIADRKVIEAGAAGEGEASSAVPGVASVFQNSQPFELPATKTAFTPPPICASAALFRMVKAFDATVVARLSAAANRKMSASAPLVILSRSRPPISVSVPSPPDRLSMPALPLRMFAPVLPVMMLAHSSQVSLPPTTPALVGPPW